MGGGGFNKIHFALILKHIIVQVSARDPDCGVNAVVHYTLRDDLLQQRAQPFSIDTSSGQLCLVQPIDYERTRSFQVSVLAHDGG